MNEMFEEDYRVKGATDENDITPTDNGKHEGDPDNLPTQDSVLMGSDG